MPCVFFPCLFLHFNQFFYYVFNYYCLIRRILTGNLHSCFDFYYQKLYESIRNEPFKIPEDDGNDLTHTFFNPDREGWLLKLGNK